MATAKPKSQVTIRLDWRGDQGSYPVCVGASGEGFLRARPAKRYLSGLDMFGIYRGAQQYDEFPGEGYDGTTARGLWRFLVDHHPAKDVRSYWWAFTPEHVVAALEAGIPVSLGIDMRDGMMDPKKLPPLRVALMRYTGAVQGGHQMLIVGHRAHGELFVVQNSWGRSWGENGRALLSADDLRRAFVDGADCSAGVKEERS